MMPYKNISINKHLIPFGQIHRRFKIIYGGRGSGKTMNVARILCGYVMAGEKICCFRQFWSSIEDSQYTSIVDEINELELPNFTILANKINHKSGGMFRFRGLERNINNVKGLKGFNKFWIDEGQDITQKAITVLTPTLREEKSECWITANPQRVEDPLAQRFIETVLKNKKGLIEYDDLHMRIKLNYMDNSWFPKSLDMERQYDHEHMERAMYDHVWLGAYNDSVDDAIIKAEWFDAAVDAHKKLKWKKFGSIVAIHDPADSSDARATIIKHGNIIIGAYNDTKRDINDACEYACELASKAGATHFVYDADGAGLGLRKQVRDYFETGVEVYEFRGGGEKQDPLAVIMTDFAGRSITAGEFYRNLRSQMYAKAAEAFEKTYRAVVKGEYIDPHLLISIDSGIENLQALKSELTSIPRHRTSSGVYQIMSKKDMMQKLKVRSPNLADCVMMSQINLRLGRPKRERLAPRMGIA